MRRLVLAIALCTAAPIYAEDVMTPELMQKLEDKGACDDPLYRMTDRRAGALLFMEDVLTAVSSTGDSLTNRVVGDMTVFQIGRNPNLTLVRLYEYAQRKDVKAEIRKHLDSVQKEISRLGLTVNTSQDIAVQISLICNLHRMLHGKPYEYQNDLDTYFHSLNRKVLRKNIGALQDAIEAE